MLNMIDGHRDQGARRMRRVGPDDEAWLVGQYQMPKYTSSVAEVSLFAHWLLDLLDLCASFWILPAGHLETTIHQAFAFGFLREFKNDSGGNSHPSGAKTAYGMPFQIPNGI